MLIFFQIIFNLSDYLLIGQLNQFFKSFTKLFLHRSLFPFPDYEWSSNGPLPNDDEHRPSSCSEVQGVDNTERPNLDERPAQDDVREWFDSQSAQQFCEVMGVEHQVHPGEPNEWHHCIPYGAKNTRANGRCTKELIQKSLPHLVGIGSGLPKSICEAWKR